MSQPAATCAPDSPGPELSVVVEAMLSRHLGGPQRVVELIRRPSAYRTSFAIEELDVRLADGTTWPLILKDLSPQALLAGARQAKPACVFDPWRELETYRLILAPHHVSAPTYYGAVVDEQRGRYWLFLERLTAVELYQVGDFAIWQQVAGWLAGMHRRLMASAEHLTEPAHLLRYDADFYRLWLRRARAFVRQTTPNRAADMEWLAARYSHVVDRLLALPVTVLHGEFYASNVLVQALEDAVRVHPVDWEMAAVGPGLIDLAALSAGRWTDNQRMALALAYDAQLGSPGGRPLAPDALLAALDTCGIHLAVQWLGWSPRWTPPVEHAQDWLSEALRLARRLGL